MSSRRPDPHRVLAVTLATALAGILAGCASSVPPPTSPPPTPVLTPVSSPQVDSAAEMLGVRAVVRKMEVLIGARTEEAWARVAAPNVGSGLAVGRFAAWIDTVAGLPGGDELADRYREILDLEREAVDALDPWAGGAGPAAEVSALVADEYHALDEALTTLWVDRIGYGF